MTGMLNALRTTLQHWLAGGSEQHQVRGFRVVVDNSRADIATDAVLTRLDEATTAGEMSRRARNVSSVRQVRESAK
jgi:hypothetical protein